MADTLVVTLPIVDPIPMVDPIPIVDVVSISVTSTVYSTISFDAGL